MIHARPDYMRIQDPSGLIPQDEPVFLLRAQDKTAALTIEVWAAMQPEGPLVPAAKRHAEAMRVWGEAHAYRMKWADITFDQLNECHSQAPIGSIRDHVHEVFELIRQYELQLEAAGAERGRLRDSLNGLQHSLGTEKRLFDKLAADRCRERDERELVEQALLGVELENFHLRERIERWEEVGSKAEDALGSAQPSNAPVGGVVRELEKRLEAVRQSRDRLREKLKSWETRMSCGHLEVALVVDDPPHCSVCDREAEIARLSGELVDLGEHLQTCPPNMCREGHPEIRYAVPGDGEPYGCPLCRERARLNLLDEGDIGSIEVDTDLPGEGLSIRWNKFVGLDASKSVRAAIDDKLAKAGRSGLSGRRGKGQ